MRLKKGKIFLKNNLLNRSNTGEKLFPTLKYNQNATSTKNNCYSKSENLPVDYVSLISIYWLAQLVLIFFNWYQSRNRNFLKSSPLAILSIFLMGQEEFSTQYSRVIQRLIQCSLLPPKNLNDKFFESYNRRIIFFLLLFSISFLRTIIFLLTFI